MKTIRRSRPQPRPAAPRVDPSAPIPLRAVRGVRRSRIAAAQARIAADFYDRGDVRDRLVEALLRELERR